MNKLKIFINALAVYVKLSKELASAKKEVARLKKEIEAANKIRKENTDLRFNYAGILGLICRTAPLVSEAERNCIDTALSDWCKINPGWSYKRVGNIFEVVSGEEKIN